MVSKDSVNNSEVSKWSNKNETHQNEFHEDEDSDQAQKLVD